MKFIPVVYPISSYEPSQPKTCLQSKICKIPKMGKISKVDKNLQNPQNA